MRSADRVAAVSLIVFAAWFVAIGRRFPYWNPSTGPGSGFLPVWLGVALTVLNGAVVYRGDEPVGPRAGRALEFRRRE